MPAPVLARLDNPVRSYAWGSHEVLARLRGQAAPTREPEAELWLGAHPQDPSTWLLDDGPRPLDEAIEADPVALLGPAVIDQYGPRLPFLLKLLAVAQPLSLQAHPGAEQARHGFARAESSGLPLDAPQRSYTDPWPKPELVRAVSRFEAFCGFRDLDATLDLLDRLATPRLAAQIGRLRERGPAALTEVVERLLRMPSPARVALVSDLGRAAAKLAAEAGSWRAEARWIAQLAERYPSDPGVAVVCLLELFELEPGESLHVPPGTLHCYLSGCCVEIMAASDNVLRGGLTAKHIDVPELLRVIGTADGTSLRVSPRDEGHERVHPAPVASFRLAELELTEDEVVLDPRGGQILLLLDGEVEVIAGERRLRLATGQSAFVAAAASSVRLSGRGTVFRATVGDRDAGRPSR